MKCKVYVAETGFEPKKQVGNSGNARNEQIEYSTCEVNPESLLHHYCKPEIAKSDARVCVTSRLNIPFDWFNKCWQNRIEPVWELNQTEPTEHTGSFEPPALNSMLSYLSTVKHRKWLHLHWNLRLVFDIRDACRQHVLRPAAAVAVLCVRLPPSGTTMQKYKWTDESTKPI